MSKQMDMFTNNLHPMQVDMVKRMATTLTNMGCKYAIMLPDGTMLQHGVEATEPRKRRPLKLPYGTKTAYVKPFLENAKPGDVICIPFHPDMPPRDLLSSASSMACKLWGNGSHTCEINNKTQSVDVLYSGGI